MITVGWEIDADVDRQKVEHLALRAELGREGLGHELALCGRIHDLVVLISWLHDY